MWINVTSPTSGENLFVDLEIRTMCAVESDRSVSCRIEDILIQDVATVEDFALSIAVSLWKVMIRDDSLLSTILKDQFGIKHITSELVAAVVEKMGVIA